jgi:hypothetical protein
MTIAVTKSKGVLPDSIARPVGNRHHRTIGVIAVPLDKWVDVLNHIIRIGLDGSRRAFGKRMQIQGDGKEVGVASPGNVQIKPNLANFRAEAIREGRFRVTSTVAPQHYFKLAPIGDARYNSYGDDDIL